MNFRIFKTVFLITITFSILTIASSEDYTKWNLPDGAKMRIGKGHIYGNITFSPDGSLLAVAGSEGIWIYDSHRGKEAKLITDKKGFINSIAFSPDGKTLASASFRDFYLWDVETGDLIISITGHSREIQCVTFNPDGNILATAGGYDKTIRFWDINSGAFLRSIVAHEDAVKCIRFSPDGKILASAGDDDIYGIKLWDASNGQLITPIATGNNLSVLGIQDIAFSSDGSKIASCEAGYWRNNDDISLWDTYTGELVKKLSGHTKNINSVAFSPDGRLLASAGTDSTICLWDADSRKYKTTLIGHRFIIESIEFSPDGNTLASGSLDGTILLWDIDTLQPRKVITGHTAWGTDIGFSPDGKHIATGCWDTTIRIWDTSSGRNTNTLIGHSGGIRSIAFSPDGKTIASSAERGRDYLWFRGDHSIRIWDYNSGFSTDIFLGGRYGSYNLIYSQDGRFLGGCSNNKAIIRDAQTGNPILTITGKRNEALQIAFSPDSRLIAVGKYRGVELWDLVSKEIVATLPGPYQQSHSMAFSPDGRTIAKGGNDLTIYVWDIHTHESRTIDTGHTGRSIRVGFSPDGKTIVSNGLWGDETLRFWDTASGMQKLHLTNIPTGVEDFTFSPDGTTLATLSGGGSILLWDYPFFLGTHPIVEDINADGTVDIFDLILVAANFGKTGENVADVNGDGVVDIADLIKVAAAINDGNGAPSIPGTMPSLNAESIHQWITEAQLLNKKDPVTQNGISNLEQLLKLFTPKMTTLLPNYPNPFNPETWIPYQLSEPSDVTIRIYSTNGQLIRQLQIGHQQPGLYHSRSRAAYWDGKNELGEPVASGMYFYEFTAGKFNTTRQMVIQK